MGQINFLILFFAITMASVVSPSRSEEYQLGCGSLPFPLPTKARPIDKSCGNEGDSKGTAKGKQNAAKNILCSRGDPITLSFSDFFSLQKQAADLRIPFGADGFGPGRVEHLPDNRSELTGDRFHLNSGQVIREGDKVQIVGFMDDPHAADLGQGEDVNCHNKKAPENDVHINLTEQVAPPKPGRNDSNTVSDEKKAARIKAHCKAIIVEAIPHYRPDLFDASYLKAIAERQMPTRITGQLFFDAAHRPCDGSTPRDSSVRGTLWEIHPIYSIDVCKNRTLDQCPASREDVWVPLNQSIGFFEKVKIQLMSFWNSGDGDSDDERMNEHESE
jgi:hypothetical protein